jgi:hypothetical protein
MLKTWFATGQIADVILLLMALEGAILAGLKLTAGRGIPLSILATNLAAGACLIMALKSVLTGASYEYAALWLAGSLVAHVADLSARWQ